MRYEMVFCKLSLSGSLALTSAYYNAIWVLKIENFFVSNLKSHISNLKNGY